MSNYSKNNYNLKKTKNVGRTLKNYEICKGKRNSDNIYKGKSRHFVVKYCPWNGK